MSEMTRMQALRDQMSHPRCGQLSIIGALLVQNLALIYAWTGEKDLAFEQLAIAAGIPGYLSYGDLQLHPFWDPLRGDPRFEKIITKLSPTP